MIKKSGTNCHPLVLLGENTTDETWPISALEPLASVKGPWWSPALDWPPLTQTNPLGAPAVRRAQLLTAHSDGLLLSCCHLGVYLPHSLHLRCHNHGIHSLLSNIAALFPFCHHAYIWAPRVFLKTASELSVCTEILSVSHAEMGLSVVFLWTPKCQDPVLNTHSLDPLQSIFDKVCCQDNQSDKALIGTPLHGHSNLLLSAIQSEDIQ